MTLMTWWLDVFLNQLIAPPAQLCSGRFVAAESQTSLQIGDSGVWHKALIHDAALARVEPGQGTFVFGGVPEHVFETGAENDRLVNGVDYRLATPEAATPALAGQWDSPRSRMPPPPLGLDLRALDLKTIKRLAVGMASMRI